MPKITIEDGLDNIEEGGSLDSDYEPGDEFNPSEDPEDESVVLDEAPDDKEAADEHEDGPSEVEEARDSADSEDGLDEYSSKVRKRILRERKLKDAERARADAAEAELIRLKAERDSETVESRLNEAITELEDARADGDTRREALAQSKVSRVVAEQEAIERRKQSPERETPNSAYAAWLARNAWFDDPQHRRIRASAIAIANDLMREHDVSDDSDALYRMLDRELSQTVRVPGRAAPKATTVGRSVQGRSGASAPTRVVITESDKSFMRKLGLNPENRVHLEQYAREKRNG